jgi:anti-sigma-K factor RskA
MKADMQDRPEDLLPFYALGNLSELERSRVESFLAEHPEARADLEEMQVAAAALARLAPASAPAPDVRRGLLRSIRTARARPRISAGGRGWALAAAAGALLALLAGAWAVSLAGKVRALEGDLVALREQLSAQESVLAYVVSPGTRATEVHGTQAQPEARGRLFAAPESESALLVMLGLDPLPPSSVYQLWLIDRGTPVSVGFLQVDEQGSGRAIIEAPGPVGRFTALGISVEPQGGSPSPLGEIVVLSPISF